MSTDNRLISPALGHGFPYNELMETRLNPAQCELVRNVSLQNTFNPFDGLNSLTTAPSVAKGDFNLPGAVTIWLAIAGGGVYIASVGGKVLGGDLAVVAKGIETAMSTSRGGGYQPCPANAIAAQMALVDGQVLMQRVGSAAASHSPRILPSVLAALGCLVGALGADAMKKG